MLSGPKPAENLLETCALGLVQNRTSREWFLGLGLGLELGSGC